ncbi:MAG: 50S ribosomal protein L22, partial [Deltaproteobacteria bacterium]|nr:50S ribosomal protein L22 [Deltaproteobacteria bacterium]
MEVTAKLRNYRVSARKARLLADEIRGKGVEDALTILDLSNKRFSKPLAKLVRSALANAEEKNERDKAGIDVDNLV